MTCEKCSDPIFVLSVLYGKEVSKPVAKWLKNRMASFSFDAKPFNPLDERDVFLITNGDQFQEEGKKPLSALNNFSQTYLEGLFSGLHILPFYPSSSDDGFAVMDARKVKPELGDWEDVEALSQQKKLMFDVALNHVSSQSPWFQGYLKGEERFEDYFISVPQETDISMVVRPNTSPLLTRFETAKGEKWVWTTFGPDRVDLNYDNPLVLMELIETVLQYIQHGARVLRLDSTAYLGKELETSCLHHSKAHLVVRLLRAIIDKVAPGVLLLTDTNAPHLDTFSYFGNGVNESHMVYNFALPAMVLNAYQTGNVQKLSQWVSRLRVPSMQTMFFNYLNSPNGIGLNAIRGILDDGEIESLVERTLACGGSVSYWTNEEGVELPDELNVNIYDALSDPILNESENLKIQRFLSAYSIVLSMAGLPGIDVQSLLGSLPGQGGSGSKREKFNLSEKKAELEDQNSFSARVYHGFEERLKARKSSPAFDPFGPQLILGSNPGVFGLMRFSLVSDDVALCFHNVTNEGQYVRQSLSELGLSGGMWHDLISGKKMEINEMVKLELDPYQTVWLAFRES